MDFSCFTIFIFSDLWSTFYEIVDDTSQIAKAHAILAESIANQIVGPFEESIRNMDLNRRRTLEESSHVLGELNEAFSILKKAVIVNVTMFAALCRIKFKWWMSRVYLDC